MKDKDEHFWIEDVINRLPSELVPDKRDWSSVLTALTKLKTERNNAVVERNELAAQVERLRGALDGIANPIGKLVKEAEDAGADIDGVYVVQFAKDAEMLKGWARSALAETPAQSLEAVKRELRRNTLDDVAHAVRYEFEGPFSLDAFDDFIESMS